MTRAVIYTRISQDSSGEREGVTRQLEDCEALAKKLKVRVVAHFDDNDISAFNGKTRPDFEDMLKLLERGEADMVIVWHVDRLYRSMKDLERLIGVVESGIEIRTVNAGDLDLSNSSGRMMARILGSVSRQESEHKAERRRRANLQRAENGAWRSDQARCFGYTCDGELFEPEASAIKQAIHDVLDGRSIRSIATEWNEHGLRTPEAPAKAGKKKFGGNKWTNLTVRRVLMKPTHAGLRVHQGAVMLKDGKPIKGTWAPIIDADDHYGLVALLKDKSRAPQSTFERRHMGSTIYVCGVEGCGKKLYAMQHHTGALQYGCKPTKHLTRFAAPLDELVEMTALTLLRRSDIAKRLHPRADIDAAALHARREGLQARADEMTRMFARGDINASELRSGTAEIHEQLAGVDKILAEAVRRSPAAALLADGVDKLQQHWDAASPDLRGKVIDELLSVTVLPTNGRKGVDRDGLIIPDFIRIEPKQ